MEAVYGQNTVTIPADAFNLIETIAVGATIIGAIISVVQGYQDNKGTGFSSKKLLSALITAVMGALALVNFGAIPEQTSGLTLIGVFIAYLLLGYGTDKGLARLDK